MIYMVRLRCALRVISNPYVGLMWEPNTATISNSHKVTLREILLYMLDASKYSHAKLLERYRRETGDDNTCLPEKVV